VGKHLLREPQLSPCAPLPGGREGLLRGGRASQPRAPPPAQEAPAGSAALPPYLPLGYGSIFLPESFLSPQERSPGEGEEDDAEAQPRLFTPPPGAACFQDGHLFGLRRAAAAPQAAATAHRPCTAPPAAGGPAGSDRGSPLSGCFREKSPRLGACFLLAHRLGDAVPPILHKDPPPRPPPSRGGWGRRSIGGRDVRGSLNAGRTSVGMRVLCPPGLFRACQPNAGCRSAAAEAERPCRSGIWALLRRLPCGSGARRAAAQGPRRRLTAAATSPGRASFACISRPCSVRRDLTLIFAYSLITALPVPSSLTGTLCYHVADYRFFSNTGNF